MLILENPPVNVTNGIKIFNKLEDVVSQASPQRQQWYLAPYHSEDNPIVLCGCGRSGTTLLRSIIDSHPAIFCGPESRLLLPLFGDVGKQLRLLSNYFDLPTYVVEQLWDQAPSQGEFVDRFLQAAAYEVGKHRWAEKTPKNVVAIRWVLERWPRAKIIHVIRDGRDVVCSLRTHPKWDVNEQGDRIPRHTRQPFEWCVERWVVETQMALCWRGYSQYCEVQYEQLVRKPRDTTRNLCRWLGESWDDNMLNYHTKQHSSIKFAQNEGINKPVYSSSVGRWRQDMTAEETKYFKRRANPLLKMLGYVTGDSWR